MPILTFLFRYWKHLSVIIIIGAVWITGYKYGVTVTELDYAEKMEEYRKEQVKIVHDLEKKYLDIIERTESDVRTIYVESDPTGCIDTNAPSGVLSVLRSDTSGAEPN